MTPRVLGPLALSAGVLVGGQWLLADVLHFPGGGRRDDERGGRRGENNRGPRPDPFARPAKPQPAAAEPDLSGEAESKAEVEPSTTEVPATEAEATADAADPAKDAATEA